MLVAGVDLLDQIDEGRCARLNTDTISVGPGSARDPPGTEGDSAPRGPRCSRPAGSVAGAGGRDRGGGAAARHGRADEAGQASGWRCCGTTAVCAAARVLVDRTRRAGRWADADRVGPGDVVHGHEAALAGRNEPENAARAAAVVLLDDWLTWWLAGGPGARARATDRGDASGTGYFSPAAGAGCPRSAAARSAEAGAAPGRRARSGRSGGRPRPARSGAAPATTWARRWSGLGRAMLRSRSAPRHRVRGHRSGRGGPVGHGPGSPTRRGGFLPLVATVNAARVLGVVSPMLGVDRGGFVLLRCPRSRRGRARPLPYLDGERTRTGRTRPASGGLTT